jgi:hypothetical protein
VTNSPQQAQLKELRKKEQHAKESRNRAQKTWNSVKAVASRYNPLTKARRVLRIVTGYQPQVVSSSAHSRSVQAAYHSAKDRAFNRITAFSEADGQPLEMYLPQFIYLFVRRLHVRLGSALSLSEIQNLTLKLSNQRSQKIARQAFNTIWFKFGRHQTIGQIWDRLRADRAKQRREAEAQAVTQTPVPEPATSGKFLYHTMAYPTDDIAQMPVVTKPVK